MFWIHCWGYKIDDVVNPADLNDLRQEFKKPLMFYRRVILALYIVTYNFLSWFMHTLYFYFFPIVFPLILIVTQSELSIAAKPAASL